MAQTSPPTNVVTCPYCGYPYPMTAMQLEVYYGRNMGCMNCGRPFKVEPPPPPAPPPPAVEPPQPEGQPQPAAPGCGAFSPATSPDDFASPTSQPFAPSAATATAGATEAPAAGPAAARTTAPKPRPNPPATASFACAVGFFVLLAAAAVCSAVSSDNPAGRRSTGWVPHTPAGVLTALAMASAVQAVLLAAVALVRTRHVAGPHGPRRTAGRGLAVAGLVLGGGGLILTTVLLSTVMPMVERQHELARREVCKTNLQAISVALANYVDSNNGRYPDSLDVLVASGALAADDLVCPSTADTPATRPADLTAELAKPRDPTKPGHVSYRYVAKGLTRAAPPDAVLLFDAPSNHGDLIHVLFRDGQILPVHQGQAAPLIQEINAGQNPGPTAHLLHP